MNSYLNGVVVFLQRSLEDFTDEFQNNNAFEDFLLSFGWRASIQETEVSGIRATFGIFNSVEAIIALIQDIQGGQIEPETAIEQAITDIKNLFQSVNSFSASLASGQTLYPLNQSDFWNQMASSLADRILINGLRRHQVPIFGILHFWGIIRFDRIIPTGLGRLPFHQQTVDWPKLGDLLSQPLDRLKAEYNWGTATDYNHLFDVLARVFAVPGSKMERGIVKKSQYDAFFQTFSNPSGVAVPQFTFPVYESYGWEENAKVKVSLDLSPAVSSTTNQLSGGLLLVPNVEGTATFDLPLGPELSLYGKGYFQSANFFAFAFHPDGSSFTYLNAGSTTPLWGAKINLVMAPVLPWILFGSADETRLEMSGLEASLEVKGTTTDPELIFSLGIGDHIESPNFHFVFKPSQGDNFLKRILGDKDFEATFGLGLVWSSKSGISFVGGGGFEIAIPLHTERQTSETVKPLQLDTLKIGLSIGNGNFKINTGVDFTFKIGSVVGVVKGVGASLSLVKKNSNESRGIFNSLDYKIGFKPPNGIGLSIDAENVKGGGFLNYDEVTSTYTGGLELKFSKISLAAIGILTTKMPDGSNGYSLLIIITAEFTPVQLGMGFTLNGVGGLLGLHRTMNTDRLRSGIKDKTLDSILFPKDIVKNANAIISNINQVFPVKKDRFLIGPMAKIGWGTPTLLTIDLGVIIEMPSPVVLAIVGVLRAILPNESSPVLKLQINFVGIIDFDKKYLSFDASLYDSSILTFPLTGDMALRLYWGDKPNFLMSVGGFHPKFTPPPMNLPQLQRLAIQLANYSNLNIRVETYFAVTSNTAQFGARVSAKAKAWKIEAIGALWFDVLFQFSPFHFIADMGVMFEVRKGGSCLLSLYIDVTLEGPHPWRVQGEGSFKILFVRVNVSFDKTFGEAKTETIAPAAIQQLMHNAILNKDNWQVIGPERSHQVVAFRDVTTTTIGDLVVDPFGSLTFSQKIAPLSIKLIKFGTSAISDINQFNITGVTAGPTGNTVPLPFSPVKDYFAPNSFFYLTDDQKLSKDSYERYNSGIAIGTTSEIKADYFVRKKIAYDEIILDSRQRRKFRIYDLSALEMSLHTMDNYIAVSSISDTRKKTPLGGPKKVDVQQHDYVIADKNTLSAAFGSQSFGSRTEADTYMASLVGTPSYDDYMVVQSSEI